MRSHPHSLKIIWPFLRPFRAPLAGAITLNALHGFAITFQVFTVGWLVDWVLGKGNVPPDVWRRSLALAAGYFFVSVFGRMVTWHIGYRIFTSVREKILAALRTSFFRQLNALCLRFHTKRSSGELFSYLFGTPVGNIVQFYQHCSSGLAGAMTTILSTVGLLLWTDWVLTLLLSLTVGIQVYMMELARRANRRIHLEFQKLESSVTGSVADLLRGTRTVKIHSMEEEVEGEFGKQMGLISQKSYERDVRAHMAWMKTETVAYAGFALMLLACAWRFCDTTITLGQVSMFMLALQQLAGPLTIISQAYTFWGSAEASLERISEVFRTSSTTPDLPRDQKPVPLTGDLEMRHVNFAYDQTPVLRDISFVIPYGQTVALVGPSGSGKSTIAQLLLRLYDPDSGDVLFGGQSLRCCAGAEVRRRFGVVPQDPFIFRTTLRQNLWVANPDASDADLERVCRQAYAWEFIEKLPQGLDTPVGEGGSNLSGGQKQRLAIARALLADPSIFLLDEPTSALDTLSEQLIQETLRQVSQGRTTIIIAHRLATVRQSQRILVIRDGGIAQDGTFEELLQSSGLFRNLVQGQQLQG